MSFDLESCPIGSIVGKQPLSPKISNINSRRFPIRVAIASWIDLLGYGSMIGASGLNPLNESAKESVLRLQVFHELVSRSSKTRFPTLALNDGAIAFRDLSFRSQNNTFEFIEDSWNLFKSVKDAEDSYGFPGPRMVTAIGFRMLGSRRGIDDSHSQFASILKRLNEGRIDSHQAMYEARTIKRSFDIVPQLQSNFAFTKAYVAESAGSGEGFGGSNWFVELSCFREGVCSCIVNRKTIHWNSEKLGVSTSFAIVEDFNGTFSGAQSDFLNAEDIARDLSNDPNILESLRRQASPRTNIRSRRSALAPGD